MVMPVSQFVRYSKSLSGWDRFAVDRDYGAVVCANYTTFAAAERPVLDKCARMIPNCLNVNILGSSYSKIFE